MSKKKLLSLSLVVIMIAILSLSSLAWFNDSDSVTNEFYVADSDDTSPDDIFSVDVYEEVDTDGDGVPEKEQAGLEFENVVPGQVLAKAPMVENTGRYAQWVKLTITFSSTTAWNALVDGTVTGPIDLLALASDFYDNWKGVSFEVVGDTYVYTYYLKTALQPDATVGVFTAVNIPTTLEQSDFFGIKDEEIKLDIKAEAIQLELGDTVDEAFENLANP